MKYRYTAAGVMVGLILPSFLIAFFARLWGVEVADKGAAAFFGGLFGVVCACIGGALGHEMDEEADDD